MQVATCTIAARPLVANLGRCIDGLTALAGDLGEMPVSMEKARRLDDDVVCPISVRPGGVDRPSHDGVDKAVRRRADQIKTVMVVLAVPIGGFRDVPGAAGFARNLARKGVILCRYMSSCAR